MKKQVIFGLLALLAWVAGVAKAADWDPKFAINNDYTSNWFASAYVEGPGPNGYNLHTNSKSVVRKVTFEFLETLSPTAKVIKSYRTTTSDWFGLYWGGGIDGKPDGSPVRIVATTNDGKIARTKPFRFRLEQPTLEGTPPAVSITINPANATLVSGATRQFSATVTGSSNTAVTWSVAEAGCGTVSNTGLYTAPSVAASTTCHTVATAAADITKSATATVTVQPALPAISSFTASATSINAGQSVQLTPVFTNGTGVINPGNIAVTSGVAMTVTPAVTTTYTLTVSNARGSATRSVTINVASVSVSISPASVNVASGGTQQFSASVTGASNTAVVWSVVEAAGCGSISASGLYAAPSVAANTTCHTKATSVADSTKSATATVTVTSQPQLPTVSSFTTNNPTIAPGQSAQLTAVFANGNGIVTPGNLAITSGVPITVTPAETTTYTVTVANGANSATRTLTVTVSAPGATGQWVMGFYASYQQGMYPPSAIDWSGLTHIAVTRIKTNDDGTLNTDFDIGDNGALAKQIAGLAHQNGKKAMLHFGGAGEGTKIQNAVRNNRAQLVANLVQALSQFGYDGYELNWEDNVDWDLFILFAQDMRAALPNAPLSFAVNAINGNFGGYDPRVAQVAQSLDRINIMSYYPATAYAGGGWLSWHNSPLTGWKTTTPVTIEDSFNRLVQIGIPKSKLNIGISFYTICYTGNITAPNQSTDNGASIEGGDNDYPLSELFGPRGYYSEAYRMWDSTAQASYLSLPQPERHGCRYVSFEDEPSILAKGRFSRDSSYGGVIIWTINQGYVASHTQPNFLMQALRKGFIEPTMTQSAAISIPQGNNYVRQGAQYRFSALVTGTADKAVTWSATCGSVDSNGLYIAPNAETSCQVTATHTTSGGKATSNVTVTNAIWNPGMHLNRANICWTDIKTDDKTTALIAFDLPDGSTQYMTYEGIEYSTGRPSFVTNYCFPRSGGVYNFTAWSSDNRNAQAPLMVPAM